MRKISPLPGFDTQTAQTVASRYTDWDDPAQIGGDVVKTAEHWGCLKRAEFLD